MIRPLVMQPSVVSLASGASDGTNGRRFIASDWDESLPLEERIAKASAPAHGLSGGCKSRRPERG